MSKFKIPTDSGNIWKIGIYVLLFVLIVIFSSISLWYSHTYGQFTSKPYSVAQLLTIRKSDLASAIDHLTSNTSSVCKQLTERTGVYGSINSAKTAIANWRPLTVRLTGYLGGIHTARDGVFDMDKAIQFALNRGARAFVFDIDYLENKPCEPILIHRDSMGFMRSINTGSIKDGCSSLMNRAFETNLDPVIIIIYIRRLPDGVKQKDMFFKSIAASLDPLSKFHLGSNEQGDFHNCKSEDILFTSPITNFQKNFIVLTNYNTTTLNPTSNPKDNLNFWTNARIFMDPNGVSASLGSVTSTVLPGQIAYAMVGYSQQLLKVPSDSQATYNASSANTFKICLSDIEYNYTNTDLVMLLNTLGIQCVPMDVVRLSALKEHEKTIKQKDSVPSGMTPLQSLSAGINTLDPLSFWAKAGWSRKSIIEGFENPPPVQVPRPIPGFIIPKPVVPKPPSQSTNSNGGLVNIA